MHITASLIPHSQFHTGAWLIPVDNPSWYYFMKKKNTNLISNDSFMESVDQPLKRIVKFLHDQKIRTTPSCSGHYRNKEEYKKTYNALENDKQIIRQEGLKLKDIETGKTYTYKNDVYQLPWKEEEFLQKIMSYQHKGVLGMRLGHRRKIKEMILDLKLKDVTIEQKDQVVLIEIEKSNAAENIATWRSITNNIENIFSASNYRPQYGL
jgi:hypothetical protein